MANLEPGWSKETVSSSIINTGFVHIFKKASSARYLAVAFPAELGELKHIYQNGLYMFDLIDTFEKITFVEGGKQFLMYKLPDETLVDNDKFEFLWKDRK